VNHAVDDAIAFQYRQEPPQEGDVVAVFYDDNGGQYYEGKVTEVQGNDAYCLAHANGVKFKDNPVELKMCDQTMDESNDNRWHFVAHK
jgi:hypothetical protein